jgi:hypothetical protein
MNLLLSLTKVKQRTKSCSRIALEKIQWRSKTTLLDFKVTKLLRESTRKVKNRSERLFLVISVREKIL